MRPRLVRPAFGPPLPLPFGAPLPSFGALAVSAGLSTLTAVAMSLLVFAGGSQFLAVAIVIASVVYTPQAYVAMGQGLGKLLGG